MRNDTVHLRKGLDRLVRSRHPWIFDGAVDPSMPKPDRPCVVEIRDSGDQPVGVGTFNPGAPIAVRVFRRDQGDLDGDFFSARFDEALKARRPIVEGGATDSLRLVNGEGDGLPGLVVDRYADHLVVQVGTPGLVALRDQWLPALVGVAAPSSVTARPDQGSANRERFEPPSGPLVGEAPGRVEIMENGARFVVTIGGGQKTGFYFDQRENRRMVAEIAAGGSILDAYCYHGAFSVTALRGGASRAVAVDSSTEALQSVTANGGLNGVGERLEVVREDCHRYLREGGRDFDVAVIDPPPLARRKKDVEKAARAYKDVFLAGIRRVVDGGAVLLCSCSSAVDRRLFDQVVAAAAADSQRDARAIWRGGAGIDHPVDVAHPEGEYLKASLLRIG